MQPRDEILDEEGLSPTAITGKGSGDEGFDNSSSSSKDSKRSKGVSCERSTSAAEDNTSSQLGSPRIPLEDMLKGLIISQIRGPFVQVEEGLLNLLKECLIAEHPFFTSAALSGHVDHFQSVDDEDLGWGCGWRNIQILCSFLLTEDPESREALFNGAGFVPDIPALQTWLEIAWAKGFDVPGAEYFHWTISGTRKWIGTTECAALLRSFGVRAKIVSFTALGGHRVRGGLDHQKSGSSLIDDDEEHEKENTEIVSEGVSNCPGSTESSSSRGGAVTCHECGEFCSLETNYRGILNKDCDLCDNCMKAASQKWLPQNPGSGGCSKHSPGIVDVDDTEDTAPGDNSERHIKLPPQEPSRDVHWNFVCDRCGSSLKGRRFKSLIKKNFDLCLVCLKKVTENPTRESGSLKDYVFVEEHPAIRNHGPPEEDQEGEQDSGAVGEEDVGTDQEGKRDDFKENSLDGEVDFLEAQGLGRGRGGKGEERDMGDEQLQKTESVEDATGFKTKQPENAAVAKPLAKEERGKAGMHRTSPRGGNSDINHHHLIEWVWSYFTEDPSRRFGASSRNSRDMVTMSKRSPLYFQHRGHSRTIVGIERRKNPTGMSEDVYLLVLDPSLSAELLVKSLREKSGWQKLVKNDVHSLKEAEYQLCYVDPGIAVGEELEQLKELSSLRYSYYSK